MAYRVNDLIAETCARHPARFQGLAALHTSDEKVAPCELERALRELGLKGALLCGRTRERHLDHPDMRQMLAKTAEFGVRFMEEQIIGMLKEHEAGEKTAEVVRRH